MWNVEIKDGIVLGMHLCSNEECWLKEHNGWAIVNFIFDDFYGEGRSCPSCKAVLPKETLDFYLLCKAINNETTSLDVLGTIEINKINSLR